MVEIHGFDLCLGAWDGLNERMTSIRSVAADLEALDLPGLRLSVAGSEGEYRHRRFEKAAWNGANVVCALFQVALGAMWESPILRLTMCRKLQEAARVAVATGVDVSAEKLLRGAAEIYGVRLALHEPSMVQDLRRALSESWTPLVTEVGDLELALCGMARRNGIDVPLNRAFGGVMEGFSRALNRLKQHDHDGARSFGELFMGRNSSLLRDPRVTDEFQLANALVRSLDGRV